MMFGTADFVGGFVTRRAPAITVVVGAQSLGLVAVVLLAPLFSDGVVAGSALGWGAAAGLAGAVALVVFYHGLATTRVAVVSSVAAVIGTATPVLFGVATGDRPSSLAWIGMVLALPALGLLPSGSEDSGSPLRGVAYGVFAGLTFGLFGILLSRTGADSGMWPLVWARVASVGMLAVAALGLGRPLVAPVGAWRLVAVAGLLDTAGNVLFLVAVRQELLSLVVVIMSLYPVATVGLARIVLRERIVRRQVAGLGLAATAVALIALG